jgi:hypothetical protein
MIECEVLWNNANRKKLKYLENDLTQCHFVHHKYHIDCRGFESRPLERLESNQLSDGIAVYLSGNGVVSIKMLVSIEMDCS